jgi:hypothetical protein
MRKILAATAAVFMAASVLAQSAAITGVVADETGGTLPGATVVVSGPGGSRTGFTGSDGKFSIVPAGNGPYKVAATMPSFGNQAKDGVAAGADVSFALKIAGLGETVVVSASKVESTLANAPVTMSVVTPATLASAPSQNFGDVLRSVPGVNVIQTSARDVNLSMRQGTSTLATSTLVLLDGRSIYLDFFGLVLWEPGSEQSRRHQADRSGAWSGFGGLGRQRAHRRGEHPHQDAARKSEHHGLVFRREFWHQGRFSRDQLGSLFLRRGHFVRQSHQ